jgi:hypothetical protein
VSKISCPDCRGQWDTVTDHVKVAPCACPGLSDELKAEIDAELAKYKNHGRGYWRVGSCPDGERWASASRYLHISVGGRYKGVFSLSIGRFCVSYGSRRS